MQRKCYFSELCLNDENLMELFTASEDSGGLGDHDSEAVKAMLKGFRKQTVPKFCATHRSARLETLLPLLIKYRTLLESLREIMKSRW